MRVTGSQRPPGHVFLRIVCRRLWRGGLIVATTGLTFGAIDDPAVQARPLIPRSQPAGATLFTPLAPAATGIVTENHYADPRMWAELHDEFKFGAIGTGVTIGDYDADGRPDLFVVSKTDQSRLFRNLGDWRFNDVTIAAGLAPKPGAWERARAWLGSWGGDATTPETQSPSAQRPWSQGATFVDVNNDGRLDLYVCRFGAANQLFINQGDGTFRDEAAARGLAVVDASSMAAFADYDRDGDLDLYLQTNLLDVARQPVGQADYLLRNRGDGTFEDVTQGAGIRGLGQGHSATWWDYDGDGWPDLYGANDFGPPDVLYHNNRDGTFTDRLDSVIPHAPHSAMGADLGDLNNDGYVDLLVADMAATTHMKDHRGMAKIRALLRGTNPDDPGAPQLMRNALYLGTGTGRVLEAAELAGLAATDWTWSVLLADLDNDGLLDVHVTNGMVRELHNADLVQRLSGSEGRTEAIRLLHASPPLAEANLAFRNEGDLRFEPVGPSWGLDQVGVSFGAALGDFDGDGDLDLVFSNYQAGATVLRNDSTTGHRLIVALRGTRSNRFGVGATVRVETISGLQVRPLVLARGYLSSGDPVLHFGLGQNDHVQRLTIEWPSGAVQRFENLPADQHLTITEPATSEHALSPAASAVPPRFSDVSATLGLALASRTPAFDETREQPLLPFRQNRRGPALAVADLDGDGHDDLLLGGTPLDPLRIRRSDTRGGFVSGPGLPAINTALDDGPILVFEADGDGAPDLLVTRTGSRQRAVDPGYQPTLWHGDGRGGWRAAPASALPPAPLSIGAGTAADFDRDGQLDVFLGSRGRPGEYPLTAASLLLRNDRGQFTDLTDQLAPGLRECGLVTSALWSDVDADGWLDLLVALEWGEVRCWRNEAGRHFEDITERAGFTTGGLGWWTSLAAADFNGDRQPDYLAGNFGLNTPYRASQESPTLLFRGQFTGTGPAQLLEAGYEDGRLFPRRGRNDLVAVIPALARRFPQHDLFAAATISDLVGADRLAAARRFAATELRSGIFLSQPNGTYRFAPLPRLAQLAPVQGLVTGDFDGDGHTDFYALQNSFTPVPIVGRFDGGLSQWWRGDGRGGFHPVPLAESGLSVPGDARALVLLDLGDDGWADFIASRHQNSTLAFRAAARPGARPLRVTLRGPVGNPTAIGARLTLTLADGTTQTGEVHAGQGVFSQSSPHLFFGHPANQSPPRLQVRWPDGRTTEQAVPAGASVLVVTAEGLAR